MVNKINYEISLWNNIPLEESYFINNVEDLVKGQTYYCLDNKNILTLCYLSNITIDNSQFEFISHSYNTSEKKYPVIKIPREQITNRVKIIKERQVEEKVLILSNTNMTYEGRARNCILTTGLRNNELTFSLPYKFFDTIKKDFIINPFVSQIKEESIIKLKLENEWFDFVVKEITETRENAIKMYQYRCVDLFIDELSRQGWTLTFNEENGMGTIDEIVPKILEDSDWTYIPVYSNSTESESDPFVERRRTIKFDSDNQIVMENSQPVEEEKLIETPQMVWNSKLNKMVSIYEELKDGKNVYSYNTITNIDIDACENLLANTENFVNTDYWELVHSDGNSSQTIEASYSYEKGLFLSLKTPVNNAFNVKQTSGESNKILEAGNYYCLGITWLGLPESLNSINIVIADKDNYNTNQYIVNLYKNSFGSTETFREVLEGTRYLIIKPAMDIKNFYIKFQTNDLSSALDEIQSYIYNIELFKCLPKKDNKLSIENKGAPDKATYSQNYLVPGQLTLIEPYQYITTKYFTLNNDGSPQYFSPDEDYTPLTSIHKVRTLTTSQTNRLSLLDDVAELFEGYPVFTIKHDSSGKILYKNGKPEKYITFQEFLVQENSGVNFKYGSNLTNITRTNLTDELITKLYVANHETNGNKISIANSDYNPILDNYVLDLSYYIKNGQLNANSYYNDLYSSKAPYLNYYANLKKYSELISENVNSANILLLNIMSLTEQKSLLEAEIKSCDEEIKNIDETITVAEAKKELGITT